MNEALKKKITKQLSANNKYWDWSCESDMDALVDLIYALITEEVEALKARVMEALNK